MDTGINTAMPIITSPVPAAPANTAPANTATTNVNTGANSGKSGKSGNSFANILGAATKQNDTGEQTNAAQPTPPNIPSILTAAIISPNKAATGLGLNLTDILNMLSNTDTFSNTDETKQPDTASVDNLAANNQLMGNLAAIMGMLSPTNNGMASTNAVTTSTGSQMNQSIITASQQPEIASLLSQLTTMLQNANKQDTANAGALPDIMQKLQMLVGNIEQTTTNNAVATGNPIPSELMAAANPNVISIKNTSGGSQIAPSPSKENANGPANSDDTQTNFIPAITTAETKITSIEKQAETTADMLTAKKQDENIAVLPESKDANQSMFTGILDQQISQVSQQAGIKEPSQPLTNTVHDPYNIASQIVEQAQLIRQPNDLQNSQMIIQLKPEHLGEVTLKVTVDNGAVSATFHSNNAEVRGVIEASLSQLKQEMSNQGLKVEYVGVYAGLGQFLSDGGQRENLQQPAIKVQNKKAEKDFLQAIEETAETQSAATDASGVDYRI